MFVTCIAIVRLSVALTTGLFSQSSVDSSRSYIPRQSTDSALAAFAAHEPDSLRAAITYARVDAAAASSDSARAAALTFATRLATSYAAAWSDSFYLREVGRFAAAQPAWRRSWVSADSTRRAGIAASSGLGVPAGMRLWRRSARAFRLLRDTSGLAAATGNLGAGYYLAGDLDSAAIFIDHARALALAVGDRRTEANAIGTLGSIHKDRNELPQARELYLQALALRERSGDGRGAAADRNNLGLIAQSLGSLDDARQSFTAALADNRAASRQHSIAINLANLATLESLIGDSPGADTLYSQALAIHARLGERDDAAVILHDIALLRMRRADYNGALPMLRRALALTDSTGAVLEHIAELADLASLQAARGSVEEGLSTIRTAQRSAMRARAPNDLLAKLAMTRGDLALSLNLLADAEREYASAERLASLSGDRALQGDAERGEGLLLTERGELEAAVAAFAASIRNQLAMGDVRAAARSRLSLGDAQGALGDTVRARRTLTSALKQMRAIGDPAGEAAAYSALGDLSVREGSPLDAENAFRHGIAVLGNRQAPEIAWALHARLGAVVRARGDLRQASSELRTAIENMERTASGLDLAEERENFRTDKWDAYATLAFIEQQMHHPADAFAVSEQLRARQALEELDRGTVSYDRDDSLAAQQQLLRHRIDELTRLVTDGPSDSRSVRGEAEAGAARDAARDALGELERRYAELNLEQLRRDPEAVRSAPSAPVAARDVTKQLRPNEVLLEYLITDSASTLFALTSDTVLAIDLRVRRHELAGLVEFARDAIRQPGRGAPAWREPLRRLYQLLIEPAKDAGAMTGKDRLIVVPHAELHLLPFAALISNAGKDHFLVERVTILTAPSASLWLRLTGRDDHSRSGTVLALAPRANVLPASQREVDGIERLYGAGTTVLRGGAATRDAFLARAPSSAVIHLASLGVLNRHNPLFSFVELAPHGPDDGRLAVTDVLALRLNARLVTLSACQTALGAGAHSDVPAGDEWVGFTSAFLRAGSRNVLASLWPVEDDPTASLMFSFYEALRAGAPVADALADAQRAAIRDPARTAPLRWAGFVLTGAR
jgi:CHAT domain-containing protein